MMSRLLLALRESKRVRLSNEGQKTQNSIQILLHGVILMRPSSQITCRWKGLYCAAASAICGTT
jgi:hypothetical protein